MVLPPVNASPSTAPSLNTVAIVRFWLVNQDGSLRPFGLGTLHLRTPANQWQPQETGQWESIGRAVKWHRPKMEAAFQNQRSLEVNLVDAPAAGHCPNLRFTPTLSAFIVWTLVSQECLKLWAEPRNAQQKQRPEWLITSSFWCVRGTL